MKKENVSRSVKLMKALSNRGWVTARQACYLLGIKPNESGKREVRSMAEASNGYIISGQLGYKLTEQSTLDEVAHARAWLISQADKMKLRQRQILNAFTQSL